MASSQIFSPYPYIYIPIIHQLYMADNTTINIKKVIRKELQSCRKYKRETYDEVLERLIKNDKKRLKQ